MVFFFRSAAKASRCSSLRPQRFFSAGPVARPALRREDLQRPRGAQEGNDAQTGMPAGIPTGAMCVQELDDSRWLQFTLGIAFRCALHRCENHEIRC